MLKCQHTGCRISNNILVRKQCKRLFIIGWILNPSEFSLWMCNKWSRRKKRRGYTKPKMRSEEHYPLCRVLPIYIPELGYQKQKHNFPNKKKTPHTPTSCIRLPLRFFPPPHTTCSDLRAGEATVAASILCIRKYRRVVVGCGGRRTAFFLHTTKKRRAYEPFLS